MKNLLTILLITAGIISAQDNDKPWIKAERERFARSKELSKVMYPGDSKIDITYYGLDLNITTNPNYLTAKVIIDVKTDTSLINSCFLDLRNFLTVDSILINGTATTFTHSNNLINITLDHTYLQDGYNGQKVLLK